FPYPPPFRSQDPALGSDRHRRAAGELSLRSADHAQWPGISTGLAIEDQQCGRSSAASEPATGHDEQIVNRIDSNRRNVATSIGLLGELNLRVGTTENPRGSDVAFGSIRENDDVMFRGGQVDLTGLRIHRYLIHRTNTEDLRLWSLNHANGRFFSVRSAAEYEDRLGQRTGHHDLVVSGIVCKIVHGPADQRPLSFER